MDREPIARSYSKLLLGCEPPLPGTCHMRHQVFFTCSSDTVEALALLISRKRLPQWAIGYWEVTGSARIRSRPTSSFAFSVTIHLQGPLQRGSGAPGRTSLWVWVVQPPARTARSTSGRHKMRRKDRESQVHTAEIMQGCATRQMGPFSQASNFRLGQVRQSS